MENQKLRENELLLLAAAGIGLIGLAAVVSKSFFSGGGSTSTGMRQPKKHCFLILEKKTIDKHLRKGGTKIRFEFSDDNGRIKLKFISCNRYNEDCFTKKLDAISRKDKDKDLVNQDFGLFTSEESGRSLHDLLTIKPISDWYLEPEKFKNQDGYVSYKLMDMAKLRYAKTNPCPPGC